MHTFWAAILRDDVRDDEAANALQHPAPDQLGTAELVAASRVATADLVAQLDRLSDCEPRWSWWPADQSAGFTPRMQVSEAAIHRVDAELTAGLEPSPFGPGVAPHIVDQVIDVMHAWRPDGAREEVLGTLAVEAPDDDHHALASLVSWTGTLPWTGQEGSGVCLQRVEGAAQDPAQATVRGTLADLARWLWNRPAADVELAGDQTVVEALRTMVEAGVQ